MKRSRTASGLIALSLVGAVALCPVPAHAGPPGNGGLGLPTWPASEYARRLRWQTAEAQQRLPQASVM